MVGDILKVVFAIGRVTARDVEVRIGTLDDKPSLRFGRQAFASNLFDKGGQLFEVGSKTLCAEPRGSRRSSPGQSATRRYTAWSSLSVTNCNRGHALLPWGKVISSVRYVPNPPQPVHPPAAWRLLSVDVPDQRTSHSGRDRLQQWRQGVRSYARSPVRPERRSGPA